MKVLDDYIRHRGYKFCDYNDWKRGRLLWVPGKPVTGIYYMGNAPQSKVVPEYQEHKILVYDADGSICGIMGMTDGEWEATVRNNHAKINFQHFLTLSSLNPERWVVVNKDTVALVRDGINFGWYLNQPIVHQIEGRDLIYCYDVIGFGATRNLYRYDKARFERAMTFDNVKSNQAAIEYLSQISQQAVNKQIETARSEIESARKTYLEVADRLTLEIPPKE